jgi:hypothetical protein
MLQPRLGWASWPLGLFSGGVLFRGDGHEATVARDVIRQIVAFGQLRLGKDQGLLISGSTCDPTCLRLNCQLR